MYSIRHNIIYRQGEKIAEIMANGLVVFESLELEKYRLPVWNFIEKQGRINKIDNGQDLAIYFENETEAEKETETQDKKQYEFTAETETSNLNINTVRDMLDIVERMSGETAPFMSQSLGDKTPEIWDYFKRNLAIIEIIKTQYNVEIKLDKLYK